MKKNCGKPNETTVLKVSNSTHEVVMPISERVARGEQELAKQIYDAYVNLVAGTKAILGLEEKNMKTLAKV